jgi:tetratricopeptide (TPR) repeat protein
MHLALGGLYGASGKLENALDEYERALAVNPNLPDAYIGLAKTYIAMHRNDDAEANLRRAIDVDVSYWASFNELGKFLFSQGRFLEAAEFFQMFVNRADDDAQALNNLGGAYYFAGDFKRAAAAWDDSLVVKPTRSAYSNTGSMYFYLGDFEQAADRYAKAVNLAPNDYRLWGNLADAYYFMDGKSQVSDVAYKRAVEFGEKQLEIDARNTSAMSDVALFYSRLGQHDKALEMDAESRRQAPDDMYVYYNSALIYAQFEQTDEALTMLERAVELEYQKELLPLDPAFEALRDEQRFKNLVAKRSQ